MGPFLTRFPTRHYFFPTPGILYGYSLDALEAGGRSSYRRVASQAVRQGAARRRAAAEQQPSSPCAVSPVLTLTRATLVIFLLANRILAHVILQIAQDTFSHSPGTHPPPTRRIAVAPIRTVTHSPAPLSSSWNVRYVNDSPQASPTLSTP